MSELLALAAPLLPVWLPVAVAPLVYLLRRQALVAATTASVAMALAGWWLWNRPPLEPLELLGRTLAMGPLAQLVLLGLALWLVAAFYLAARVSQGWSIFPFLMVVYALIALALWFESLAIRVLLLQIAWLVVIMLVQGGAAENNRAATRLLILSVLALPPFLLAAWLIEQRLFESEPAGITAAIIVTLAMGFALMLAIIPFHAWLPQAAEDGPPLVAAWLLAGMGGGYLVLLIDLLGRYDWLAADPQVQQLLFGAGLLLGIGGGALALPERHLGRLWAYATLVDLGYLLLALSVGGRAGTSAALLVLAGRLVSLLVAGGALAAIRQRATSLDFDALVGSASQLPLLMLAFAIGGLGMLGLPLTAGFPGHWAVLQLLADRGPWLWALLGASTLGLVGFLRAFAVMTTPADEPPAVAREPMIATTLLILLALLAAAVGLIPRTLDPLLARLLDTLL